MMKKEDIEYFKSLARERFAAMPPEVSFSIGEFGDFTRDQLIEEINLYSEVGREAIEMQIDFIKKMPRILASR
jgi:hypothetical protein